MSASLEQLNAATGPADCDFDLPIEAVVLLAVAKLRYDTSTPPMMFGSDFLANGIPDQDGHLYVIGPLDQDGETCLLLTKYHHFNGGPEQGKQTEIIFPLSSLSRISFSAPAIVRT